MSYGSGRPGRQNVELGISSCGQYGADREAAASLVALGARAVPEIERALDSIERLGGASEFALGSQWLVDAYAQIKGREAYSRLARFGTELGVDLGDAVALSLGLTSVVSASRRLRHYHPLRRARGRSGRYGPVHPRMGTRRSNVAGEDSWASRARFSILPTPRPDLGRPSV